MSDILMMVVQALIWMGICYLAVGRAHAKGGVFWALVTCGVFLYFVPVGDWGPIFYTVVTILAILRVIAASSGSNKTEDKAALKKKDKPIGGSRLVEALIFEGDTARAKKARKKGLLWVMAGGAEDPNKRHD